MLHRRSGGPRGADLHPRLLPAPGRTARGRWRARTDDQGHGRAAATGRRTRPGGGAAEELRRARARTHPRHRWWPAGHPDRGGRGRRGRRRRRVRAAVGRHQPAEPVRARRCHRPHPTGNRDQPDRAVGDGAVLGGGPRPLRAVRGGAAGADGCRLPARDPRRPADEPAPAGDRPRAGRQMVPGAGVLRPGQRPARQAHQGHAHQQGRRGPGAVHRRR